MWKSRRPILEMVFYGAAFAVAMRVVRRLPIDFSYKAVIGGAVGGLLAFLREPAWEFISSKFRNKK
ncbi:MAG: hypothetical protein PHV36_03130 [Elusimicrobiales bacterium]|nr:hypothetical protein [Elusimicrobiales bacterium]